MTRYSEEAQETIAKAVKKFEKGTKYLLRKKRVTRSL